MSSGPIPATATTITASTSASATGQINRRLIIRSDKRLRWHRPCVQQHYIKVFINKGQLLPDGEGVKELSNQDKKIVALVCRGDKNREIADELCLNEITIKAHVSRIFRTLKVRNRPQLGCPGSRQCDEAED